MSWLKCGKELVLWEIRSVKYTHWLANQSNISFMTLLSSPCVPSKLTGIRRCVGSRGWVTVNALAVFSKESRPSPDGAKTVPSFTGYNKRSIRQWVELGSLGKCLYISYRFSSCQVYHAVRWSERGFKKGLRAHIIAISFFLLDMSRKTEHTCLNSSSSNNIAAAGRTYPAVIVQLLMNNLIWYHNRKFQRLINRAKARNWT